MLRALNDYKHHYKALFILGIPIVIGQLGIIVLGFADTMMIGHHSTSELAAASFVNQMFNLAIIFGTGFSYDLTPIVGGLYGNRDYTGAGKVLKNSLAANFLVSLVLMFVMLMLYLNVDRLGQPEELLPLIRPYFLILLVSLVFVMLFNAFKQFANSITDTKTSMWIMLGGNVLNIGGNYLLIYGKWGLPELGLIGAGIATLLSRIVMVIIFYFIFTRSNRYAEYRKGFRKKGFLKSLFRRLNTLGWPLGFQMGMETASFSLSTVIVGWLGALELASHQIMLTVSTFCFLMYYGMGAAIAVRVSNFTGTGDIQNVRRTAYSGFHIIMLMAIVASGLIYMLRYQLGGWFTDDTQVSMIVVSLMLPMLLYQFGDGLQITFANALREISDVKPMMIIAFISYFIISLPAGYIFGFMLGWGITGIWMAFPFGLTSAGIMLYLRFRQQTRGV
ncbi:MAG: MATE family efflux transporter [Bacteroides sp.]|nr:MATE family efflux transporter [Bacteroides sp.]